MRFFAMMNYMSWLGRRVPDEFVIQRARTDRWLLPVHCTVGLAAFVVQFFSSVMHIRSPRLVLMLIPIVLAGLIGALIALVLYWNLLDRVRKHLRSIEKNGAPATLPKM